MVVIAGGHDQDQTSMGGFQEWPQVSAIYANYNNQKDATQNKSLIVSIVCVVLYSTNCRYIVIMALYSL